MLALPTPARPGEAGDRPSAGQTAAATLPAAAGDWAREAALLRDRSATPPPPEAPPGEVAAYLTAAAGWLEFLAQVGELSDPFDERLEAARQLAERLPGTARHQLGARLELLSLRRITDQISNTDIDSPWVSEEEATEGRAAIDRLRGEADVVVARAATHVEVAGDPILAARLDFERGLVTLVAKSEHPVTALAATGVALRRLEEIGTPAAASALAEPLQTWLLLGADLGQEPERVLPRAVAARDRLREFELLETPAGANLDDIVAELAAKRGERDLVRAAVANRRAVHAYLHVFGFPRWPLAWLDAVDALFKADAPNDALGLALEVAREDATSLGPDDPALLAGLDFMIVSGFGAAPPWAKVEYLDRLHSDTTLVGAANPERRELTSALADAYEKAGRDEAAFALRKELGEAALARPSDEEIEAALAEATPDEAGLERLRELGIKSGVGDDTALGVRIELRRVELVSQMALASGDYYSVKSALEDLHKVATSIGRGEMAATPLLAFAGAVRARLPRDHENVASTFDALAEALEKWGHGDKADPLVALARDERLLGKAAEIEKSWREGRPYNAARHVEAYLDLLGEARRDGEGPAFARDHLLRASRTLAADGHDVSKFYEGFLEALERAGDAGRSARLKAALDPDTLWEAPRDRWCPLLRGLDDPLLAVADCAAPPIFAHTTCTPTAREAAGPGSLPGRKDAALAARRAAFEAGRQGPLDDETAARLARATPDEAGKDALAELAEAAQNRGDVGAQVRIAQRAVELTIQAWSATEDDSWSRRAFRDLHRLATSVGHAELVIVPLQSLVETVRARIPRKHDDAGYLFESLAELVAWDHCQKADELYLLARNEGFLEPIAEAENYWKLGNFDFAVGKVDDHVDELAKVGRSAEGPAFVAGYVLRVLRSPDTDADDIGTFYLIFLEAMQKAGAAERASHLEGKLHPDKLVASPRDQWCDLLRDLQEPLLSVGDCTPVATASRAAPAPESQDPHVVLLSLLENEQADLDTIGNEKPFDTIQRLLDAGRAAEVERLAAVVERRFGREHPLLVPIHAEAARRLQAGGRTADAVAALRPVAGSVGSPDWRRLGLTVEVPEKDEYYLGCLGDSAAVVAARCAAREAARKLPAIDEARGVIDRITTSKARNSMEVADGLFEIASAALKAKNYEWKLKASVAYVKIQYSIMENNKETWELTKNNAGSMLQGFLSPEMHCNYEPLLRGWKFIPPDCAEQQWELAKWWGNLFKDITQPNYSDLYNFTYAQEEYLAVAPERAEEVAAEGLRVFERFRIAGPSDVAGELVQRVALAGLGEEAVLTVQRGRDAERRWAETADRLFAARRAGGSEVGDLEERLGLLGRELEEVRRSRADLEGRAAEAVREQTLDIPAVQASLAPDEAIVLYRTGLYRVVAWVVRKDRVVQRQLPLKATDLPALTRRLLSFDPEFIAVGGSLEEVDVGAAHELHQGLVAPLADVLDGVAVLNVIPDGPLVGVPFAMLVSEPPPEAEWAPGRTWRPAWLLDRYAFATAPTVRGLLALRRDVQPSRADHAFAGFGAPGLSGTVSPWGQDAALLLASGSGPEQLRQLSPLPDAEREVRAAAAHFPEEGRLLLLGPEFTEPRLRSAGLDRYRTLLFATHAVPSGIDRTPMLVLTPPEAARPEDDGALSPGEVGGLKLDADLVILSACRTGLVARGEKAGYGDLVSAFFAAGSRAVMATYWPIDSATAPLLTVPVAEAVAGGGHTAAVRALREAALAVSRDQARLGLAHPAHWAAFYIVGAPGAAR